MLVALLVVVTSTIPKDTRNIVFAAAKSQAVTSERGAPLGKLVKVEMPFFAAGDTRVVVFDEAGHAAVVNPDAIVNATSLPFSEGVTDVSIVPATAVCARTKSAGLECLYFVGDVFGALAADADRVRVKRLTFPSLQGQVEALGPAVGPCVVMQGEQHCAQFRVDGSGAKEQISLVAPLIQPKPPVTCSLGAKGVECEGRAQYLGQLGDGKSTADWRTTVLSIEGADEVLSQVKGSCAHTKKNEVWCWGVVPSAWTFTPAAKERLPVCKYDRRSTDATWRQRNARERAEVEQCAKTCGSRGVQDACLGCVAHPIQKQPQFIHEVPCEEPVFTGDATQAEWPFQPLPTLAAQVFSSRPVKLDKSVGSIAAGGGRWCLVSDGALSCSP